MVKKQEGEKPKRVLSQDQLDKLKLAREKALAVKKQMKENTDDKKIKHYEEKITKIKSKKGEPLPEEQEVLAEEELPPIENLELIEEEEEEEEPPPPPKPSKPKAKPKKKPVVIVEESNSESSDDENVIYIKRRGSKKKERKEEQPQPQPQHQPPPPPQVRLNPNPFYRQNLLPHYM